MTKIDADDQWAREIARIGETATDLAEAMIRYKNRPMARELLWAEYEFAKAMNKHFSTADTQERFAEAANEVGRDANDNPYDACDMDDWGDYHHDTRAAESYVPAIGGAL